MNNFDTNSISFITGIVKCILSFLPDSLLKGVCMSHQRFKMPIFTSLVVRKANKILLLKRNKDAICGGYYAFPGGGVDGSESVSSATMREAYEEIGITIQPDDLQFVHVYHFIRKNDVEYVNFFFQVFDWQGEITNKEAHKCDEVAWFDLDHLPENILPGHAHVSALLDNNIQFSEFGWE